MYKRRTLSRILVVRPFYFLPIPGNYGIFMKGNFITGNNFYVCHMINIIYKNKYMKTLKMGSFLLLMGTINIATLRAQTADEILGKHIEALGGKAVVSGIKSVVTESTVDVGEMGQATSTTYIINGKAFKNESDFNGMKIIQVVTDKSGWTVNPPAGQTTPVALTDEQVKIGQTQTLVGGPLIDYAAKGYKLELIGKDTTGGVTDYKLRLTGVTGVEPTYYISAKTWLLDKEVDKVSAQGQEVETTTRYSDYKKAEGGYVYAGTRSVVLPQITLTITNKKIEVNKEIDPKIFDMPK
jgi:hypothetical protein